MQTEAERREADARLQPFAGRVGSLGAGITAIASLGFIALVVVASFIVTATLGNTAMTIDFRVFWGAAKLAAAGQPLATLDPVLLGASHATHSHRYLPWLYPPGLLLLITPLGLLSFSTAFLVWTVAAYAAITLVARPFVAGLKPVWILVALSPAYLPTMLLGQTSLFWMAGLLAAMAALRAERWILAGVLIGCLTLKPQLGLMIPFALLGLGAWRTIFAAAVTTVVLLVVPTLIYGLDYWWLLQAALAEHSDRMLYGFASIQLMISPLYTLCFYGMNPQLAMTLQLCITAAMTGVVAWFWRSRRAGFDVKVAVLLIAIVLTAPYLWYYEAVLLAAVALFLLRGGVLTPRPRHLPLLFLLWMGCGLLAIHRAFDVLHEGWLGAAYISPLLLICLGLCLRKTLAAPQELALAK